MILFLYRYLLMNSLDKNYDNICRLQMIKKILNKEKKTTALTQVFFNKTKQITQCEFVKIY